MFALLSLGDNVNLDHAYIWNNVDIASNVAITQSVVCDRVVVKEGVTLNKQCVLAFNVSCACFLSVCLPTFFLASQHNKLLDCSYRSHFNNCATAGVGHFFLNNALYE